MGQLPPVLRMLESARKLTGAQDLGDPHFLDALNALVESINAQSNVPDEGLPAAEERLMRLLVNRLRIQADLADHPEILREQLLPPLVISGLPRVGSTKLQQLLAKSGDFQALLFWQGYNPARHTERDSRADEARIAEAVRFLQWRSRRNPAVNAAHFLAAAEPEEDTYLLEFTLHSYWPTSYFEVPGFLRWLDGKDRDHAFAYLRQLLQYLQSQFHPPPHRPWVLKSPINLGYEPQMARQLPGARFIMLHRDPVEVVPSLIAIVRELRRLYCGSAGDLSKVAAWALQEYSSATARHLAWRRTLAPNAVLDLAYTDVRDDYVSVVERVYEFCGMPLAALARKNMANWVGDNEQHKHGVHQYTLDESGLSTDLINSTFSDYLRAFSRYIGG